jgi:hypothetical protein
MDFQLIPVAKAQTLDATAQPTFGPVAVSGGENTDQNVQVLLSASSTNVAVGSEFTVSIELKTGTEISVSEYQIVLTYDPQTLTPIDQDTAINGIQSKSTDSLFTVPQPVADNNYATSSAGLVFIRAKGDFPLTINRKVVEVKFQAQRLGSTEIKVDATPIQGTRIRRGETDIAYTPSSLKVDVTQTGTSTACTVNSDCPTNQVCLSGLCAVPQATGCTSDIQCSSGQICSNSVCITQNVPLPQTALWDDLAMPIFVMGLCLIAMGLYLRRASYARD